MNTYVLRFFENGLFCAKCLIRFRKVLTLVRQMYHDDYRTAMIIGNGREKSPQDKAGRQVSVLTCRPVGFVAPFSVKVSLLSANVSPISTNVSPVCANVSPVSVNVSPVSTNVSLASVNVSLVSVSCSAYRHPAVSRRALP